MSRFRSQLPSGTVISKRKFLCGYCGKRKTGAYRWVDGKRSCEKCNRAYDYRAPPPKEVECPVCHGEGVLQAEES